jgi:hypothetical protein
MAFIDIFAPILLKLYEHIFDEKTLSNSQKVSYITLICKDPEKHYDVKKSYNLLKVFTSILIKLN